MKKAILSSLISIVSFFTFAQNTVQVDSLQLRLDNGESPKAIIKSGGSMDSLYAKVYQGGYIFYFFPEDTSGLVLGLEDLKYKDYTPANKIIWGCRNNLVGAKETKIGSGLRNTMKISKANCTLYNTDDESWMKSAADICLEYKTGAYDDWYLPSKDELHESFMKLSYTSKVEFGAFYYWTSSEKNDQFAWIENLKSGYREYDLRGQSYFRKYYARYVRPVRNFK